MTWDATAYAVTIKALGTVESSMRYGAVNMSDPITIGLIQWYGTRAAALLFRIQSEASTAFDIHCPDTIKTAMSSHPASDSWWNHRHVTKEEANGLANLLTRASVKTIQNDQVSSDMDGYLDAADRWGIDKDDETKAAEFFCTIYNQSPRAAARIADILPAKATLSNIYSAALNDSVVGAYRTRQITAYNIIKDQDSSGVDLGTTDDNLQPPPVDGGDGNEADPSPDPTNKGSQGEKTKSNDQYIVHRNNLIILHKRNGNKQTFYKSGGLFLPADNSNVGSSYTDDSGNTSSIPPVNTDPSLPKGDASAVISWARSKLGDYSYSQGPGRLNPEKSGYCDCSGFLVYAFQHAANVSLGGTYTGNLCTAGSLVLDTSGLVPPENALNPGDLIFLRWGSGHRSNSPFDHVELYCGGGRRISMGHTPGPDETAWDVDIVSALNNGGRVMVRRYLN